MAERRAVTKEMQARYRGARKLEKGRMLEELCLITGWSRGHARQALTGARAKAVTRRPRRPRLPTYGPEVMPALKKVWAAYGGICGKRLSPFMGEAIAAMERHDELKVDPAIRAKLVRMSAATIDRMLAPERRRLRVGGRSGTKPGTLLRHQVPIRTFADWDERRPGFVEVDLVGHDGGSSAGEFCQALDLTCVFSGWTEIRAVPNKAQLWVFEALKAIEARLPFPLLGLDSDNGSEFINHDLVAYCADRKITFTRSRPYRKNDNCFVEQKNWTVVRQQVGYARYDTAAELEVLNELYGHLRLVVNFFSPVMKLVEKTRQGARIRRRYDTRATPYRRLLACPDIEASTKRALTRQYRSLNPVQLRRDIDRCQKRLQSIGRTKARGKEVVSPPPDHPWRTSFVRQRKTATRTT